MKVWFGDRTFDCDAIAFDKDGTLVDREVFWQGLYESRAKVIKKRSNQKVLSAWEAMNGMEDASGRIDPDSPLALGTYFEEKVVLATAIYWIERGPWDDAIEQAGEILAEADANMSKSSYSTPLPGVPHRLMELAQRGLPLCVLTADVRKRTMDVIQTLGLGEAIKCVVTPGEVERAKPAADMIFYAAEKLKVEASKMVMVGDSVADMKMARAAGTFAVAISNVHGMPSALERLSDVNIGSIEEIRV